MQHGQHQEGPDIPMSAKRKAGKDSLESSEPYFRVEITVVFVPPRVS